MGTADGQPPPPPLPMATGCSSAQLGDQRCGQPVADWTTPILGKPAAALYRSVRAELVGRMNDWQSGRPENDGFWMVVQRGEH